MEKVGITLVNEKRYTCMCGRSVSMGVIAHDVEGTPFKAGGILIVHKLPYCDDFNGTESSEYIELVVSHAVREASAMLLDRDKLS